MRNRQTRREIPPNLKTRYSSGGANVQMMRIITKIANYTKTCKDKKDEKDSYPKTIKTYCK